MARRIFCRWCMGEAEATAGAFPTTCAECGNIGRWSTEPGVELLERRKHEKEPRVKFDLTHNDRRLLKQLRIARD